MPADKIDVQRLAREADQHADRKCWIGGVSLRREFRAQWYRTRDEHFARLVLEEAAKVALAWRREYVLPACCDVEQEKAAKSIAEAIRARMP